MKKFFKTLLYIILLSSIVININLYTKYSKTNIHLQRVGNTASNSYEHIFESVVHSEIYYQTFDIGRVSFLQGKMEGAFYCTEMFALHPNRLPYSKIAEELKIQLAILSKQYYTKGSFNYDDEIVYKEILQEISDVYNTITNSENSKDISAIRNQILMVSYSIKTKYGEN